MGISKELDGKLENKLKTDISKVLLGTKSYLHYKLSLIEYRCLNQFPTKIPFYSVNIDIFL